jgi:hypothetical protein
LHCFLSHFLYIGHRFPSDHSQGIFSSFHIFIINWCIFYFNVRPPFFIYSGNISPGPAALLDFMFLIILFISSYVDSSSSELFIGPSCFYTIYSFNLRISILSYFIFFLIGIFQFLWGSFFSCSITVHHNTSLY